jgi:hypothetical protein
MHRYSLLTGGSVHLAACVRDASVQLAYGRFGASGSLREGCFVHSSFDVSYIRRGMSTGSKQ